MTALVVGALLVAVCSALVQSRTAPPGAAAGAASHGAGPTSAARASSTPSAAASGSASASAAPRPLSGTSGARHASPTAGLPVAVGADLARRVPAASRQLVLVVGRGHDRNRSTVYLLARSSEGSAWQVRERWSARNGYRGWTWHHHEGDLRSPVGVYRLTDAGGFRKDPGTRLPYHRSDRFGVAGEGVEGESLRGAFDYVLAIDYNRVAGSSPADGRRPEGRKRGGGIWFHVDHGGATRSCISLSEKEMRTLLRTLVPAAHPVVVMGDRTALAR